MMMVRACLGVSLKWFNIFLSTSLQNGALIIQNQFNVLGGFRGKNYPKVIVITLFCYSKYYFVVPN